MKKGRKVCRVSHVALHRARKSNSSLKVLVLYKDEKAFLVLFQNSPIKKGNRLSIVSADQTAEINTTVNKNEEAIS